MEIYSKTTRFALACNDSEKIIGITITFILSHPFLYCPPPEPIQSRCAMLRYTRLTDAQILERLLEVCDKENVSRETQQEVINVFISSFVLMMVWRQLYSQLKGT